MRNSRHHDRSIVLGIVILLVVVLLFVWIAISRPGFFQNFSAVH